jgi:hypothetical protein
MSAFNRSAFEQHVAALMRQSPFTGDGLKSVAKLHGATDLEAHVSAVAIIRKRRAAGEIRLASLQTVWAESPRKGKSI